MTLLLLNVTMEKSTWNKSPWKFEAGTQSIAQVIGLGAAIDYLNKVGMDKIASFEQELLVYAEKRLLEISGITLYGSAPEKGGIISFNIDNIHSHDVAHILDTYGIAIRAGHHCAQPIMKRLEISATNRISFYIYNTFKEIDELVNSLHKTIKLFN